jgi:hypothetical protein
MSDTKTPETDAVIDDARNFALYFECRNPPPTKDENIYVVPAEFARGLERDRDRLKGELEEACNAVDVWKAECKTAKQEIDQLKTALSHYVNHPAPPSVQGFGIPFPSDPSA